MNRKNPTLYKLTSAIEISRRRARSETAKQSRKYIKEMVSHTSLVRWVEDITCIPWKVSSSMEMMVTMGAVEMEND